MQSIRYNRKTVFYKAISIFLLIIMCIVLAFALTGNNLGPAETIFYSSAMVIGLWFFALPFIHLIRLLFSTKPLLNYDQEKIQLNNGRTVPWSNIKKIESHQSSVNKWFQSVPPFYRFILNNHEFVDVKTFHAFSTEEFNETLKHIRVAWNRYK